MKEGTKIGSGKIIFAEGIKKSDVQKKCVGCIFNVSCQGPDSAGGTLFAYVADEVSKPSDQEIRDKANCLGKT